MLLFFKKDMPADESLALALAGYSGEESYFEPDGMPFPLFTAFVTAPITQGSITLTLRVNGSTVASVQLVPGGPRAVDVPTAGAGPGAAVDVQYVSSVNLQPADTLDVLAVVA